jgi:AcrR family transcriptional regulator
MRQTPENRQDGARERILESAYDLFSRRSIRDVGIGEVIERAAVAKATLYRHFPSKDALVLAFLARRGEVWTRDLLDAEARRRGATAERRLLALFDVLDEWFRSPDYESCSFVSVLLEMGPRHLLGREAIAQLEQVREAIRALAVEAGLHEPDEFARSCQLLVNGSIVAAAAGDVRAAVPARQLAQSLIDQHRARPISGLAHSSPGSHLPMRTR